MSLMPRPEWPRKVPRYEPESLPDDYQGHMTESNKERSPQDDLEAYLTDYLGDAVFAKRFAGCMTMLRAKNADYSQGEQRGDRTAAFKRIARDTEISPEKVWYVFFSKHIGAIVSYIKRGQVESEPIDGRIDDAINYLVLLGDLIGQKDGQ